MKRIAQYLLFLLSTSFISYGQGDENYYQALELGKEGYYAEALEELEKALALDSDNIDFLNTQGLYLSLLQEYELSIESYEKAIATDSNAISFEGIGISNYKLGNYKDAISNHSFAISLAKDNDVLTTGLVNRSSALMALRRNQEAYDDLMEAYSIDSMKLAVLTNLGTVCDDLGRSEEALNYLFKAVDIERDHYPAFINIGFIYQQMDEHMKAIYWFNSALDYVEDEPLIYSNRSYSKLKSGDLVGALEDINKSIEIYPANSYAYRNKALILLEQGKNSEACENLQMALDKGFTQSYGDEVQKLKSKNCN